MAGYELVEVDGAVRRVEAVGATDAAVVGEARGDGESGAREDDRAEWQAGGGRGCEESCEGQEGAGDGGCGAGNNGGCW